MRGKYIRPIAPALVAATVSLVTIAACSSFNGEAGGGNSTGDDGGADHNTSVGGEARPEVTLEIPKGLAIEQGKTLSVDVKIVRKPPFTAGMTLAMRGLPVGVAADPVDITPTVSATTLKIVAVKGAPQGPLKNVTLEAIANTSVIGSVGVDGFVRGAPGELDTTFGKNGVVALGGTDFNPMAMAPDGSVFLLERVTAHRVVKYTKDGVLDTTFGSNGEYPTAPSAPMAAMEWHAPNLYVAGTSNDGSTSYIRKLDASGKVDTTFGSGGTVTNALGSKFYYESLAVGPSGELMIGGASDVVGWVGFRLSSGLQDAALLGGINLGVSRVDHVLRDGARWLAVGGTQVYVFKTAPPGSSPTLDNTFGPMSNGTSQNLFDGLDVKWVSVDAKGNYVVGGLASTPGSELFTARLTRSGVLDTTYNPKGLRPGFRMSGVLTEAGGGPLAVAGDKIVQVATVNDNETFRCVVVRYDNDGALDTTFGVAGRVMSTDECYAGQVAIQPDGRILVSGSTLRRFWN